jgi:hypothetical protein
MRPSPVVHGRPAEGGLSGYSSRVVGSTGHRFARLAGQAAAAITLGCGGAGDQSLDVGSDVAGPGMDASFGGGPGSDASLSAIRVSVGPAAPVLCPGSCVTLSATASGGTAPYSYAWSNGATGNPITVCPKATTTYTVTTTDSSGQGGEFPTPGGTARGSVIATVAAAAGCDAGVAFPSGPCDSLAETFSPAGVNPVGSWSYGWSGAVGSTFTLYPTFFAQDLDAGTFTGSGWPAVAQWFDPSQGTDSISGSGPVPDIQFNPLSVAVEPGSGNFTGNSWVVGPNQIVMSPSAAGADCSVARWTAPSSGTYGVKAAFASAAAPGFTDTADVHVLHNGVELPSANGTIDATTTAFSLMSTVAVTAGDTIDFVVAPGTGLTYRLLSVDAQVCSSAGGDGG